MRQQGFCRRASCHPSTEERVLSSDADDFPSRVLPYRMAQIRPARKAKRWKTEGSTIADRGDFPSVSGDNIDVAVRTYRLAFCLKLQHRPRYTWLFVPAV